MARCNSILHLCGCGLALALVASPPAVALEALVFSRTTGFRHRSIPAAVTALDALASRFDMALTVTEDPTVFTSESLANFDVAVFLHTTESAGNPLLSAAQQAAFEQFIAAGNGFVGIHAASDVTNDWPWFVDLLGARFQRHPSVQDATVRVVNPADVSTRHLDSAWVRLDEWYDFRQLSPTIEVLLELDESTYSGGMMGEFHPISWKQDFGGGRSWYTGMGHVDQAYSEVDFLNHLAGGILWAAGATGDYNNDGQANLADYTVWRDQLGGQLTAGDYETWKLFYGIEAADAQLPTARSAVREPPSVWALLVVAGLLSFKWRTGPHRNAVPLAT